MAEPPLKRYGMNQLQLLSNSVLSVPYEAWRYGLAARCRLAVVERHIPAIGNKSPEVDLLLGAAHTSRLVMLPVQPRCIWSVRTCSDA